MKRAKSIFLWCGELVEQWRGWLPYWGFCSKKVRTSIKKHRQNNFKASLMPKSFWRRVQDAPTSFASSATRQTRRPPLAVSPAGETLLRASNPAAEASSCLCYPHAKLHSLRSLFCGGYRIRTCKGLLPLVFKTSALSRSANPPWFIS